MSSDKQGRCSGQASRAEEGLDPWIRLFKGSVSEFTWEGELDGDETVRLVVEGQQYMGNRDVCV